MGGPPPAQRRQQPLHRAPAAVGERLADRREPDVRRELQVVEADDGEVAGHVEALLARRLQHAERLRVGRGEDRGRRIGERQQLAREPVGDRAPVRAEPLQPARDRHARGVERLPVPSRRRSLETKPRPGPSGRRRRPRARARARAGAGSRSCRRRRRRCTGWGAAGGSASSSTTGAPRAEQRLGLVVARRERDDQQPVAAVQRRAAAEVVVALAGVPTLQTTSSYSVVVERRQHAAHALHRRGVREEGDDERERPVAPVTSARALARGR